MKRRTPTLDSSPPPSTRPPPQTPAKPKPKQTAALKLAELCSNSAKRLNAQLKRVANTPANSDLLDELLGACGRLQGAVLLARALPDGWTPGGRGKRVAGLEVGAMVAIREKVASKYAGAFTTSGGMEVLSVGNMCSLRTREGDRVLIRRSDLVTVAELRQQEAK